MKQLIQTLHLINTGTNTMKRQIFMLLLLSLNVVAQDNLSNRGIQLKNSLLWEISGNELTEPSYLYGTMHLLCDKSNSGKAKVQNAVDATKQLYLEVDMFDPKEVASIMKLMTNEAKIKDIKDNDKKQQLLTLTEKHLGMKGALIENTSLFAIIQMMSFKAIDSCTMPSSVEATLESKFNHDRSKIAGLETMAQQIQFLRDSEVANLDNTILGLEEFDEMKGMYVELTKIYMAEDITALYTLMTKSSDLYPQEYLDKMMEIMLVQRNKNWTKQIPKIARQSPTFFGVGAGHLPGENGVINLLRQQGYTVNAVMD